MALPMPRDDPVMTATLPSRENNDICVSCGRGALVRLQTRFSESWLERFGFHLIIHQAATSQVNIPEFLKGENEHFL
jgi:hypothetical protein